MSNQKLRKCVTQCKTSLMFNIERLITRDMIKTSAVDNSASNTLTQQWNVDTAGQTIITANS